MRSTLRHACGLMLCAIMLAPASLAAQQPDPITRTDNTRKGTLESTDGKLPSGQYFDEYLLTGDGPVTIVLESAPNFDAFLIVRSPQGRETENDDFSDSSTDAGLLISLTPGEWKIIVTSYDPGETGNYTLTARF